jgi:glutathione S-transferase
MTAPHIVFYCFKYCPWALRTWLALEVANADFQYKEVDLANKPDWFLKASPTGKVPTLEVGEKKTIIVESAITTRLIGELYPESGLLSKDPIVNAQSELWADRFVDAFNSPVYFKALKTPNWSTVEAEEAFFKALDSVLPYLGAAGPFAVGQKSPKIGDLLVAPFIGQVQLLLEKGILPASISERLKSNAKYAEFNSYVDAIHSLPAFKKSWNADGRFQHISKKFLVTA